MEEAAFQITQFVRRPGIGQQGRPTRVRTNYFDIETIPQMNIIQYDVTITPEVPPRLRRNVFARFIAQYRNQGGVLGNTRPVFDGVKNIFSPKLLPFGQAGTFNVQLAEDDGPTARRRPPRDFTIKLRRVGDDIVMAELEQFLNARSALTNNCLMAITAMDVIIRHKPSMEHVSVGRSFYTPKNAQSIFGGAVVWQGYYQSARPTRGKMLINIDLSATAFYEDGPLVNMVVKILNLRHPNDLIRGISDRDRQKVERSIKNLRVYDNHREGNRRKFKIEKLTPTPANRTMFDRGDGSTIDVKTYFENTYNRRLLYPNLPCVVVRKTNYLPIELCDVIPGQRHIRKLDERQTADMIKFTCLRPNDRANRINAGLNELEFRQNEFLQEFGMRISNEMVVVNARILPVPTVKYHPSSREHDVKPRDGVWALRDKKLATGATLGSWSVLAFLSQGELNDQVINTFLREFINTCQANGMNIPNRNPPILHANPIGDIEGALKEAWLRAGNTAKAQPQVILCILPNKGTPLYAEIKRVGDTVIGVVTQCIQSKHVQQAKRQLCANVCLKLNVKLGGMNSFIEPNQIPFVTERPTLLIGGDVTHHGPGEDDKPSIAALCGSMDAKASRYAATIRVQTGRYEIIADLANMVKDLLKTFYQTCGRKPERILFYRDGVSEGQFRQVLQTEINAIRAACQALEATYRPNITFVVVQKRHHTRFFPLNRNDTDNKSGNCAPGTVVEVGVTHPFEFDFYLQSHAGIQGTSRPTHYHVLFDENGFNADSLQTLSYNLCHIYARCTRTVSLVPPVYYAHLVTTRAKFHTRWNESESSQMGAEASFGVVKQDLQKVMYFM